MLGAFNAVATILAVRFILLVSVGGGIVLAWIATKGGQPLQLGAVGLYTVTVCVPLVWLSSRR